MPSDQIALDRRGNAIEVGDRVFVMEGLTTLWGPFARVISTADGAAINPRAIVIRAEWRLPFLPDLTTISPFDPIIAAYDVEITPSALIVREYKRSKKL